MEQQDALLVPDRVDTVPAVGDNIINHPNNQRPRRTLAHLAVLSAVVLPIVVLPYLASRRNTSQLQRQLNQYAITIAKLQRDLKTTMLDNALRRDDHARIRGLLTEMKQETRNLSAELRRDLQRLNIEGEQSQIAFRNDHVNGLEETRRKL